MAMKIHGSPHSTATMRALAAAYEKDVDFEFVPVDMASGAHKQQPFLSLNVCFTALLLLHRLHLKTTVLFGSLSLFNIEVKLWSFVKV